MDVVFPYVHDRKQFGQAIGEFQLIQGKMADMFTVYNAARTLVYSLARTADEGKLDRKGAAAAILYAAEQATQMALQVRLARGGRATGGLTRAHSRSRSWAATATSTTTRRAGCCATPSCTRSARAPRRSAAC
jgi:alkylation response protein AidB-like acyl-CoA dehydrogenase